MENRFKPSTLYLLDLSQAQKGTISLPQFYDCRIPSFYSVVRSNMQRAFVVQIKAGCERGAPIQGRVEHVRSGGITHSENAGQLIEFFVRCLEGEALEEADRAGTERGF